MSNGIQYFSKRTPLHARISDSIRAFYIKTGQLPEIVELPEDDFRELSGDSDEKQAVFEALFEYSGTEYRCRVTLKPNKLLRQGYVWVLFPETNKLLRHGYMWVSFPEKGGKI